jgi:hypothetical protein
MAQSDTAALTVAGSNVSATKRFASLSLDCCSDQRNFMQDFKELK